MALFSYETASALPRMTEAAVDLDTGQPILDQEGRFRLVHGREAVQVWVRRALEQDNARFAFSAHTDSYGHQLHLLAGRPMEQAESRLAGLVREALLVCPYIKGVERFSFTRQEGRLTAAFTVRTVYGEFTAESEAEV